MSEQMLDMSVVRIDGDTQPRTAINPGIVQEYAEAMEAGVELPPVTIVHDGSAYWLVDGFHRFFAHRRLSRQQIKADVTTGELTDARWLSLAANKAHGVRRSNEDKAKAVARALKMRPDLSDMAIASHVGVSNRMVGNHRSALDATLKNSKSPVSQTPTRVGRDGRAMNTSKIGRRARRGGGISKNAFQPVRGHSNPQPMRALNMPQDPVMGARTLIELFDTTYLRALVAFLTKHLEGAAA
ncbi:MAG: ParB/RepB/Spo0J family partition protein [Planctomycetota bacterium]